MFRLPPSRNMLKAALVAYWVTYALPLPRRLSLKIKPDRIRSAVGIAPKTYDRARDLMILAYLQAGKYEKAVEGVNRWAAREENPWILAWRAAVYGRLGHPSEARRSFARLEQLSDSLSNRTPALLIAYSGMGQNERVIELLQRAYSARSNAVVDIKVNPMYDAVRGDARFQNLLQMLGLKG